MGIGRESLRLAIEATAGNEATRGWRARIHEQNSVSLSTFLALGFGLCKQASEEGPFLTAIRPNETDTS